MSVRRHYLSLAIPLIIGAGALFAATALVFAQDRSHIDHAHIHGGEGLVPIMPGQDAFGTIQEIVRMLEADPATDWSKVNIGALREHLINSDDAGASERACSRQRYRDRGYRRGANACCDQAHGSRTRA